MTNLVETNQSKEGVLTITLNDPKKRNALGIGMFDAIDSTIESCDDAINCVLLCSKGPVFCAGFDMQACSEDLDLVGVYINRLSALVRSLRRLPVPVVCAAHGAAIAGGCAVLTGCDFIVGSADGKYGYPVHQLGISPAVTIPTLNQRLGYGQARSLLLGGEILDGNEAHSIGLLTHLCDNDDSVQKTAETLAVSIAEKPPYAIQVTKQLLNELDGSLDDSLFDPATEDSAKAVSEETRTLLRALWSK
ncbi:MAG TPA: enoyl-CoA hydratase/isomerase family protein [Phycisphaerales bacterium]|nr:enoyl-CoA hydratase/isomerase family protein [Phycisphaerales bacterium]